VLGFFLLLALGQAAFFSMQAGNTISYSEFKSAVRAGRVQEVIVSDEAVRGTMKAQDGAKPEAFNAVRIEDPKLVEELEKYSVPLRGERASRWMGEVLGWVIPLVFFVALWGFFFRRMGGAEGGVMSFARSKAKVYADDDVAVRFADVAGVDEAEEELKEIVEFLKTPKKYTSIGGRIPKGVLLVGPPGTGKRCSSASAHHACATCSHRPMPRLRASSSSTNSMRSARSGSSRRWAATKSVSRR
jgi:cell division protease FtsH